MFSSSCVLFFLVFHFNTYIFCALTSSVQPDRKTLNNFKVQLKTVESNELKDFHNSTNRTDLKILKRENTRGKIVYTLGEGRYPGDAQIAQTSDYGEFPGPQDVDLVLSYPRSGVGAQLSFVQILVDQSSNSGNCYVLSGGIGQRSISILVEAHYTTYFSYLVDFYGFP